MAVSVGKSLLFYFCFLVLVSAAYTGLNKRYKRQGWFGQTKPAGKRCLFNPCDSGVQFCKNEARCALDESNCMFICHCQNGYTGRKCETKIEATEIDESDRIEERPKEKSATTEKPLVKQDDDKTILRSIQERTCIPGFICEHGYCDRLVGLKCRCDDGWTGQLCSTRSRDKAASKVPEPDVTNRTFRTENNESTMEKIRQLQTDDVCSPVYVARPKRIRECAKGMHCVYGSCRTLENNNGFRCECDKGAVGSLCEKKCCQKCGDHGVCKVQNGTEVCSCEFGYTGDDCDNVVESSPQMIPNEETWYLWLIGVCACVFLILLLMAVILPYFLWYNRNRTVMKAVYSFQPFEDDDDMKWDAFVSYKSDGMDETFVNNKLKAVLEGEFGFTLCLPQRDFQESRTLEKNILDAVLKSRRIIIILTPRYIHSEFPRYEYQYAHEEILKRKSRVIPIILDDISAVNKSTDPVLKRSISHTKSLKWSNEGIAEKENAFWEKIKLSMPKRRTLKSWSKGMRRATSDSYLNDKQIVLSFSENDSILNTQRVKKYSEETDNSVNHIYENVAFEKENNNEVSEDIQE